MGVFASTVSAIRKGLARTREALGGSLRRMLLGRRLSEELIDELEARLAQAVPEEEALDMVDGRLIDCPLRSRGLGGVPLPTRMVAVKGLEPLT